MSFYSPFLRVWLTGFTIFHVRPLESLGALKAEDGKGLPIGLLFAILLGLLPNTQALADTVNSIRTFQHISTVSSVAFSCPHLPFIPTRHQHRGLCPAGIAVRGYGSSHCCTLQRIR